MAPHRPPRLEKGLVLLLLLTLALPLLLTAFVHYTAGRAGIVGSWRQGVLHRAPGEVSPLPVPTLADVKTTRYQAGLANRFDEGFAGRDWVHRSTQEMYLRLFGTVQGPAVLGRNHSAFYNTHPFRFVDEYSVDRPPAAALDYIVTGLRLWRESCLSRGVGFAIVITPSKAAVYPEDLPPAWQRRHDPRPRAYDHFVRLLNQEHIPYVDGHLLTMEAKAHANAPVFPLGGTHWGQYPALLTANAVLRELASQGQPVRPIEHTHNWIFDDPVDEEADIAEMIQPLFPWSYPVNRLSYRPVPLEEGRRPSLDIIGGSFVGNLGLHLYRSGEFSEIHWLRYYKDAKEIPDLQRFLGWNILLAPIPDFSVERDVYAAQNLVLEVNEQFLTDPRHLRQFFDETLGDLPGVGIPKTTFAYDAFLPCRWNEPIRFSPGMIPTKPGVFSDLCYPDAAGSWSNGPDTTVRLTVPDLDQDVELSVLAGATSAPDKHPAQRVSVFANGEPVAEWIHETGAPQTDTAVIPKALLADGRLILRFHFSNAAAPSTYSDSKDIRRLALLFSQLTLRQPRVRVDGPVIPADVPGQGDPVFAANFSDVEHLGRWTVGPSAALVLPTPPGTSDVTLSAQVGALINPAKLPVQRTGVLVNGEPVGEWVFLHDGSVQREVVIPRKLLTDETMRVEFRFSKTLSSAELGSGEDTRQLALLFKDVQLHWFAYDKDHPDPDRPADQPSAVFLPLPRDQTLHFAAGARPEQPGIFSGLFPADPAGSWSDGPDTTLCLRVPDPDRDVVLSVFAGAAFVPNRHPVQRVNVFANGHQIATWTYDTGAAQRDEAVIPHAFLNDGRVVLRFHFAQPVIPADYSDSKDTRRLALLFSDLTLRNPSPHVDGPVIPAADTVQGNPVFAANFSGVEPGGRWTDGPSATLVLPVPPGLWDVRLSAQVSALLDPVKLPAQHAGVFVNGTPVGEWRFSSPGTVQREVSIPRKLLTDETMRVEFRFSRTLSPAQVDGSADTRQLALLFKSVQLHWFAYDKDHPDPLDLDQPDHQPNAVFLPLPRDQTLHFAAGARPEQPGIFSGLFPADPAGSWSDGPDTTLRLRVPDPGQDVVLSVFAGATAAPNQRPAQRVRVFANGHQIATWTYDTGAAQRDEAVIPRALLGDGRVILRFHFSQPVAPADYGDSKDTRRLAVLFSDLTLRSLSPKPAGSALPAADAPPDPPDGPANR